MDASKFPVKHFVHEAEASQNAADVPPFCKTPPKRPDEKKKAHEPKCDPPEGEAHEPNWVPIVGSGLNEEDMICADIRRLQQRTGCCDSTCDEILQLYSQYTGSNFRSFKSCDKKLSAAAGVEVLRLNGCTGCHKHVFMPGDKATVCPLCNHPRHGADGQPLEVCCKNIFVIIYL